MPIDIYRIAYFAQKKKRGDGILRGNGCKADAGEGDGLILAKTGDEFPRKIPGEERWIAGFTFS